MLEIVSKSEPAAGPARAKSPTFKANHAYQILKQRILEGVYAPGDWLRLSQIARELSLSEMPIREALRFLQKDGLVVLHLNRGAQVAQMSMAHSYEIVETRMHLEKLAAVSATPHHTEKTIREMAGILQDMRQLRSRPADFALKNRAFCTALFQTCPNKFLIRHIQELWDLGWQHSTIMIYRYLGGERLEGSLKENRQMLDGIKRKDPEQVGATYDARIKLTLEAWRHAADEEASRLLVQTGD